MRFRPCIDLHEGRVKQIVGSTLSDTSSESLVTNFQTARPASCYAAMYRRAAEPQDLSRRNSGFFVGLICWPCAVVPPLG